ncbi:MAG TPA: GGDEF domain-containing protein [Gemmataceae bacterium]|nr:GGDEF domain-containing protein [Gemmataceae bacterium]
MHFFPDPMVSKEAGLVVTTFQTTGTLLIALMLRLLTRGIPGLFLRYWSDAWAALALALVGLSLSAVLPPQLPDETAGWVARPALAAYCVFAYLFGFYLWAGCRALASGAGLRRADWWLFALPAAFGLVAPVLLPDISLLFPFHAGVFAGFCLLALLTSVRVHPDSRQTVIGLRLVQVALAALVLLFWHYAVVMGWRLARDPDRDLEYLHYSALYDTLVQTLLAFGMVVLGTDSVRRALEAANRELAETNCRLAEAGEQLALAARTDPLTGLLNRRAFEAMRADRLAGPFAGSVAVVDLNHLKRINDESGHKAGDAAIQLVARALRGHFRITDPVFRTGGDEFLVVLEGGRSAELAGRLEAVDAALHRLRLPGVREPIDLVIAWGMADFDHATDFDAAVARADQMMYECKSKRKAAVQV